MTDTQTTDPNDVAPAVAELDTIVSLSKRRGFIFPSSEIYGGINAVWDYGPLGVELKNNVKRAWWRAMVQERDDIVGLDAGILMHPQVWVTSGHVGSFSDPLVECQTDHRRFRLDELPGAEDLTRDGPARPGDRRAARPALPGRRRPAVARRAASTSCSRRSWARSRRTPSVIYLRPETAQGSYVNFKNVQQSSRKKLPFGIAQIGKSFRNEISPGNFVFRMREFEQMEMQYFVRPEAEAAAGVRGVAAARRAWYERYGVTPERLRLREHAPDELAHYAKKAVDVEYRFPFGWKELEGVHNRGDFDLSRHSRGVGREPRVLRPGDRRARHPVDRRDGRRRRPGGVHVPHRRLPRGGGPRRDARRRWRSIPTSRRTRSPSCRCSRSGPRSSSCATASRTTSSATRWPSTTTRPRSASSTGARTRSARRGA